MAAGALHERQQLLVAGHVGAHLSLPLRGDAAVDHHLEELLEAPLVGGEVVVVEEDRLRLRRLQLGDDALGAAHAVLAAEHHRHGAEGAVERAPQAGHDRRLVDALRAHDQREVGHRERVEIGAALAQLVVHGAPVAPERQPADALELALAAEGLEQLQHEAVAALSASDVVGVRQGVVGREGGVRAADDHRKSGGPQLVRQGVGSRRRRGGRRDPDEVGRGDIVAVDGRRLRRVDPHVVARGLERRTDERQTEPRIEAVGQDVDAGRRRFDEADLEASGASRHARRGRQHGRSAHGWLRGRIAEDRGHDAHSTACHSSRQRIPSTSWWAPGYRRKKDLGALRPMRVVTVTLTQAFAVPTGTLTLIFESPRLT